MCADVARRNHREIFESTHGLFSCENPQYPEMRRIDERIDSFDDMGNVLYRTCPPIKLAQAGFFYSRFRNEIICWYCGGGLEDGDYSNDPWYGHAKYHSQCEFVLREKGIDYVSSVVSFTPGVVRSASAFRSREERRLQPHVGRRSQPPDVDIFPRPQWLRHDVDLDLLQTTTVYSAPGIQITSMRHDRPHSSQSLQISSSGGNQLIIEGNNPQENHSELTRKALGMGFSLNQIKAAMSRRLLKRGQVHLEIQDLINDIVENSTHLVGGNLSYNASSPAPNNETTLNISNSSAMEHSRNEDGQLFSTSTATSRAMNMCTLCESEECKLLFLPCAHLITCTSCGTLLNYCPLCKAEIDQWIKVKSFYEN